MDPKMSVGLDTTAPISLGMPGQPWVPTPSPTLKLTTPSLEPLHVSSTPADWTANPHSTGFTPAFTPSKPTNTPPYSSPFALPSPGVSGEIAGVVDNPASTHSTSLADLFKTPHYPFTTRSPKQISPPVSRPTPSILPPRPAPLHPPRPPTAAKPPTPSRPPPTVTTTSASMYAPPFRPSLPAPVSYAAPANAPLTQPIATVASVPASSVTPQPPSAYHGYAVMPAQRSEQVIAPLPSREEKKDASPSIMPTTGHRSVLGSGIVSSAVQEAQVRARMKAESFAKMRKRKRCDEPVEEKEDKVTDEDSKLTPDELRKKRYKRRLALNRESAAVSRVRRREYVKLLEEQLVTAEKERVRLATELSEMQRQHNKLREHLAQLERSVQDGGGAEHLRRDHQYQQ